MESRKQNISKTALQEELKRRVSGCFGRQHLFSGIHVFTSFSDVPDEYGSGPRLVVLSPNEGYSRVEPRMATDAAGKILQNRGDQPRQKRNRLLFLAPDADTVGRLSDACRTYLAWKEIVGDIADEKLNLDSFQTSQAKKSAEGAESHLLQVVRETYKWLLCPTQFKATDHKVDWETVSISTNAPNLVQEIESKLREEEWITSEWSPLHLQHLLEQWYFKEEVKAISALKVYQDTCHYLYLPRLINDTVFSNAISQGINNEDFFAYASGKDDDRYLGFLFGDGGLVVIDNESVLIEREAAVEYRERTKPAPTPSPGDTGTGTTTSGSGGGGTTVVPPVTGGTTITGGTGGSGGTPPEPQASVKNQFYGTIDLDPVKAKMDFANIVDEVVQQFFATMVNSLRIS